MTADDLARFARGFLSACHVISVSRFAQCVYSLHTVSRRRKDSAGAGCVAFSLGVYSELKNLSNAGAAQLDNGLRTK